MAKYRAISLNFWTDSKIADDFTPEDRYFYLYLFTNPHTNLCGCYEISIKQMVNETGYSKDTIERLIDRFKITHKVIDYSPETKEIFIVNWHKYNWTSSEKFKKPLLAEIEAIKCTDFKSYLTRIFHEDDTVSIPYQYGSDTPVSVTVSVTDKYIDIINKNINEHNYSSYISNILRDWFLYKKEKGQSYKPIGLTKFLNKVDKVLSDHSEKDLGNVIEKSMENNYQGIVWDWLNKKTEPEVPKNDISKLKALENYYINQEV